MLNRYLILAWQGCSFPPTAPWKELWAHWHPDRESWLFRSSRVISIPAQDYRVVFVRIREDSERALEAECDAAFWRGLFICLGIGKKGAVRIFGHEYRPRHRVGIRREVVRGLSGDCAEIEAELCSSVDPRIEQVVAALDETVIDRPQGRRIKAPSWDEVWMMCTEAGA